VIAALAEAMDRLAEEGALVEGMSIAGRERALGEGFPWPDILDGWIAIYHEVLARRVAV
jgi:glycosyltransferase involved in cell wall biosynthesis